MHKTYQAKNFGIVCGKKNDRGGRNIFIFRSEIGSVTGGIRRHGRIYRFADAIFYRLGLCRSFSLGFRRREYPAVQFRGRAGDSGADGARPFALSVRCRFGEYARRYDLLLDRAFGQAGLDYPLPAGRAGENRPGFPFLEGKGALFAFFTFLPYVGEAVAIVLGLMRSNVWITAVAMFVGKLLRYVAIVAALQGVLSWF